MSLVLTYQPPAGAAIAVTVNGPDLGNETTWRPSQRVLETIGGQVYVYQRGPVVRALRLSLVDLADDQRAEVDRFLAVVGYARRWWTVTLPTGERDVLRAGWAVGGATIKCGATYKAGQRVLPDALTYTVRVAAPDVAWVERQPKHHSTRLQLRVLDGYLPAQT